MIQTHYVPLERPYRIVYTGGVMGLQVGTLIVVRSGVSPRAGNINPPPEYMTTSTHPVVSYVNKKECGEGVHITDIAFGATYSEVVVWDKVDQSEVLTICLEGQELKWEDYLYILTPLIGKCKDSKSTNDAISEARRFFHNLRFLGGTLQYPPSIDGNNHYTVHLDYCSFASTRGELIEEPCLCADIYDFLPFAAPTKSDEEALKIFQRQLRFYKSLLRMIDPSRECSIEFCCLCDEGLPEYEKVKAMVDKLNLL